MSWFDEKAVPAIKKWWKPLAILVGIVLAVIFGRKILGRVVDAIFGKVVNGMPFTAIPGDPAHVTVQTAKGPQIIRLPVDAAGKQITSDQVKALAYAPGYLATVELLSQAPDRRVP